MCGMCICTVQLTASIPASITYNSVSCTLFFCAWYRLRAPVVRTKAFQKDHFRASAMFCRSFSRLGHRMNTRPRLVHSASDTECTNRIVTFHGGPSRPPQQNQERFWPTVVHLKRSIRRRAGATSARPLRCSTMVLATLERLALCLTNRTVVSK